MAIKTITYIKQGFHIASGHPLASGNDPFRGFLFELYNFARPFKALFKALPEGFKMVTEEWLIDHLQKWKSVTPLILKNLP